MKTTTTTSTKKLTTTSSNTIAGIDLSLTSPSICIFSGQSFNLANCKFFYLTSVKKLVKDTDRFSGVLIPEYNCNEERYDFISKWILTKLIEHNVNVVCLEDYAYAATGRVFHIAENGGVVKYTLWCNNIQVMCIPPTQIKKFATSKGNANKELMEVAFIEETGYNVKNELGLTSKQWNPSSDIIDSYFICKYGYNFNTLADKNEKAI